MRDESLKKLPAGTDYPKPIVVNSRHARGVGGGLIGVERLFHAARPVVKDGAVARNDLTGRAAAQPLNSAWGCSG